MYMTYMTYRCQKTERTAYSQALREQHSTYLFCVLSSQLLLGGHPWGCFFAGEDREGHQTGEA